MATPQTETGSDQATTSADEPRPRRHVLIGVIAVLVAVAAVAAGSLWYFTRSNPVTTPTSVDELRALLIRDRATGDPDVQAYSLEQWAGRPQVLPRERDNELAKLRRDGFRWHVEMAWDAADAGRRRVELTQYETAAQAAAQVESFRSQTQAQFDAKTITGRSNAYVLDNRDPAVRGLDHVHALGAEGTIMVLVSTSGTLSTEEAQGLLIDQLERLPTH